MQEVLGNALGTPVSTQVLDRASPPGGTFVARLDGPSGLAIDVVRQFLEALGVAVLPDGGPAEEAIVSRADVVVLVEPRPEHWAAANDMEIPIVLVQETEADDRTVIESVLAGAEAVLHCDCDAEVVVEVIAVVSQGGSVLRPSQMRTVAAVARAAQIQPGVALSRREAEILASIADGKAVKQTARDLGISPKTVENLQARLFRKLTARNRSQAVTRGHALGLL